MSDSLPFAKEEIDQLLKNLDNYSEQELLDLYTHVEELEKREYVDACYNDLIAFCKHMMSDYLVGSHHKYLADLLQQIENGNKDRICVNVPPRHGKSQLVSIYYPAWFLGRNPDKKVMLVSHTADLAVDFGRKVRNLIASDKYKEIFPEVSLSADSKSAGRWNTNYQGEFYATGVGSALAGRGADLLLVDDPHSEQDILNGNLEIFTKAYEWFTFGARTRLMPGGRVAIVHCLVGDTGVMRPDGTETPIKELRPGDHVLSYNQGALSVSKVLNWANQGPDAVFTITTTDGKTVIANERHPFLVSKNGDLQWTKLKELRPGDSLVSLKDAKTEDKLKLSPVYAINAVKLKLEEKIQSTPLIQVIKEKLAQLTNAKLPQSAKGYVVSTTTEYIGSPTSLKCVQKNSGTTALTGTMAYLSKSTTIFSNNRKAAVEYAKKLKTKLQCRKGGQKELLLPSIIATLPGKLERCFATNVTLSCKKGSVKKPFKTQFSTSEIISIEISGVEDVYDIQVEGTENFIANGVVSHNTRWHTDDLTGRVIKDMAKNPNSDQYELVEFPAIVQIDKEDGNVVEKPLWPEFFDMEALNRTKASMPAFQWQSQYQQQPTAEEAAIVKREWWRRWKLDDPPSCDYLIMSLDAAAETHNRADFTSLTTWGVFFNEEVDEHHIILLNSICDRYEFPELKALCLREYNELEPDSFIVEKKSAGVAIYQEMRRGGIPVQEFTPHRGTGDKIARLNAVSDMIASGMVWVPETRWAEELIEEIAAFPFASHDDRVDSTTQALMRFRQGGFVRLPTDWEDDPKLFKPRRRSYY